MRSDWLISLFLIYFTGKYAQTSAAELQGQTSADVSLADLRSITIYDSLSKYMPFELRERGVATYSASNRSGSFSESGIHSRPHDGAEDCYRIGTENYLALWLKSESKISEDVSVDETLVLHLDLNDDLYYTSYFVKEASAGPGALTIKIHHSADHIGPTVSLKKRVSKGAEAHNADSASITDEDVPEKTFLQKYWIYAVPAVLLMVLSAGGEQQ